MYKYSIHKNGKELKVTVYTNKVTQKTICFNQNIYVKTFVGKIESYNYFSFILYLQEMFSNDHKIKSNNIIVAIVYIVFLYLIIFTVFIIYK